MPQHQLKTGRVTDSGTVTLAADNSQDYQLKMEEHGSEKEHSPRTNASSSHASDDSDSIEYPGTGKLILILCICAVSIFLVALDNTILSTAIPRITYEFSSLEDVAWYGSGFFITMAAFQSLWGKAYKYFGVKSVFLVALLVFGFIGSTICAAAPTSAALIVGRAIAGIGGAGINSGTYLIIALVAPPKKMPALQGVISASFTIASIVGPLLGGVFTTSVNWRWCFWMNLPIAGAVMAFVLVFFRTPAHVKPSTGALTEKIAQMDFIGTILILGAVICILLALQYGGVEYSWSSSVVIGLLVGAVLISVVFILAEIRLKERAALSVRLLKKKTIIYICLHQVTLSSCFFVLLYELPIYFQAVTGVNAMQSGIRTVPFVVSSCASAVVAGLFMSATGEFQAVLVTGNTLATIGSGLLYTLNATSPAGHWIGYQILAGFGLGLSVQTAIVVCQSVVKVADLSTVTATILFLQLLAGSVWLGVGQALVNNKVLQQTSRNLGVERAMEIFASGASELRTVVSGEELPVVVQAYLDGLKEAYVLCVALAGFATCIVIAMAVFHRKKLGKDKDDEVVQEDEKI